MGLDRLLGNIAKNLMQLAKEGNLETLRGHIEFLEKVKANPVSYARW